MFQGSWPLCGKRKDNVEREKKKMGMNRRGRESGGRRDDGGSLEVKECQKWGVKTRQASNKEGQSEMNDSTWINRTVSREQRTLETRQQETRKRRVENREKRRMMSGEG